MNFKQFQQWWDSVNESWKKIILEENLNISSKVVEKNFKKILNLTAIDTGFDGKLNKKIKNLIFFILLKSKQKNYFEIFYQIFLLFLPLTIIIGASFFRK